MVKETTSQVSITLTRSQIKTLDKLAEELGMSRSGYLRHMIRQKIIDPATKKEPPK